MEKGRGELSVARHENFGTKILRVIAISKKLLYVAKEMKMFPFQRKVDANPSTMSEKAEVRLSARADRNGQCMHWVTKIFSA